MSRCVSIVYRRVSETQHLYRDSDTCHRDRSTVQRDIRFCHHDRLSPRPETMAVLYFSQFASSKKLVSQYFIQNPSALVSSCNGLSQTHVKGRILEGFKTFLTANIFLCVFSDTVLQLSLSCQENQVSRAWNSMLLYGIGKALLEKRRPSASQL